MTTAAAPSVFRDWNWRLSYKTSGLKAVSILHDFYIPALQRAARYERVAGYFRSTSLAAASQGFSAFVDKQGKMRLLVGADLEPRDVEAILKGEHARLIDGLNAALGEPANWSEPEARGVELLAWMVKAGLLEVRVALRVHAQTGQAIPLESQVDGYVHEKWAVLADGAGDRMYISGSLNESKTALMLNAENIDVHCAWRSEEARERTDEAEAEFAVLWANEHPAFRVLTLPDAVQAKLISFAEWDGADIAPPTQPPKEVDGTSAGPVDNTPSVSEWLAFKFIQDAPRMRNGQYLGIETAPIEAWPHQRIVARRLVDGWPLSWMLCDEVGLGKTIETGLALRSLVLSGFVKRALIAAPASVAPQWQREMADKFFLPFTRALTGGKNRHKVLFPQEMEQPATSLYSTDLNIVSTGLLVREQRQVDLKAAEDWDVVLLDEAHYARRSNPAQWAERPAEWNKLFKVTKDVLRTKSRSLWLATATPMQLEPIEAVDLAALTRRLGPFGDETQIALAYYDLLGKIRRGVTLDELEWAFLARVVRHVMAHDEAVAGFVRRTLLRGRDRRDLEQWLKAIAIVAGPQELPFMEEELAEVQPGSAVTLRNELGETVTLSLDPEGLPDLPAREGMVAPSGDIARCLLGVAVGRHVSLPGPFGTEQRFVVEGVTSTFRRLLRIAQERVNSPVASDLPVMSVPVPKTDKGVDFSHVHAMLKRQSEHSRRALQGYADNPITLGILGKLLGRSVVDMVSGWPSDAPPLFVCAGTKEQREAAVELLQRADAEYVIDAATVAELGPSSFRVEPNSQNRWSSSSPVGMWAGCI